MRVEKRKEGAASYFMDLKLQRGQLGARKRTGCLRGASCGHLVLLRRQWLHKGLKFGFCCCVRCADNPIERIAAWLSSVELMEANLDQGWSELAICNIQAYLDRRAAKNKLKRLDTSSYGMVQVLWA